MTSLTEEEKSIVERLREGLVEHPKRWSGDTHSDLGGSVDYEKTDAIMQEAAAAIQRLERELEEAKSNRIPDGGHDALKEYLGNSVATETPKEILATGLADETGGPGCRREPPDNPGRIHLTGSTALAAEVSRLSKRVEDLEHGFRRYHDLYTTHWGVEGGTDANFCMAYEHAWSENRALLSPTLNDEEVK